MERACMSTTADKDVALFYANGRGTVVEISVGRIQIGGDVSFLSMVIYDVILHNAWCKGCCTELRESCNYMDVGDILLHDIISDSYQTIITCH